ncbi:MAG: sigma 54-interacting transcriptional regulator [Myxococcales bacterium]|nr:sigma 54-interacting transcriptional regulator [Myxococcales bacterium]MBL0197384.1 sigma 54-interacting transcriptional regulator [Myxococcales bacterium]HQY62679.1 sigma 54-interacting transcriptional regulator [Polyangiaceae bacterium]
MENTIVAKGRLEVRGGTLSVKRGAGNKSKLEIGPEITVIGRNEACDLVLDDKRVSAVHVELIATERGVRVRDLGSRNGTFLGDTRVGEVYLLKPTVFSVGESVLEFTPSTPETVEIPEVAAFGPLVGSSAGMRAVFERCRKAAPTELTVLILGETGCGKELVAQAIHQASTRAHKPFVVVDCGSIPPSLAESALFGHERGSFTGAVDKRISPFVEADGGTIFLDELGELPVDVQPKLLRALAEQRIKSVGSNNYKPVNVRVIAATRRDLVREVNAGTFRSDLYFRVAQLRVELPPLRERLEDIPALVRKMMIDIGDKEAYARITSDSLERLMRHDWPGNVRELRNVISVALAFGKEGPLDLAQHLAPLVASSDSTPTRGRTFQDAKRDVLARFEREYFTALYAECSGNVSEIGRRSAMERAHVRGYLRRHGIGDPKAGG